MLAAGDKEVSTVSWGAAFPTEWPRKRIKFLCRFAGGGTPEKGNPEYWNGDIPWVSPKDMQSTTIDDTEDHITADGLECSAARLVAPGAVLLVMRSGILRHSIPVAINRVSVALNQDMRALIPLPQVEARFLARLLEGHQQQLLNVWSKVGSTVESLESDLVGETQIAVPTLDQQLAIADYLDRETTRLDALVAAKERGLGLLAEKRRALITRTVTRGLDSRASLDDSGIPWLGQIPSHWEIAALRFLVNLTSGATPDTGEPEYWDGEIPWVSPKDMKLNEITDTQDHVSEMALSESTLRLIEPDAVLVVVRGMILAHSFPTALNRKPITINQDMKALRCCSTLAPRYLRDFFHGFEKHIVSLTDSSTHGTRRLDTAVLGRLEIPLPPLEEQQQIVTYIGEATSRLDALQSATRNSMALLKERRAALIAAAVTGQLEVT